MLFVAEEVRRMLAVARPPLARRGGRARRAACGARERGRPRAALLDLAALLAAGGDGPARYAGERVPRPRGGELGERLAARAAPALEGAASSSPPTRSDRRPHRRRAARRRDRPRVRRGGAAGPRPRAVRRARPARASAPSSRRRGARARRRGERLRRQGHGRRPDRRSAAGGRRRRPGADREHRPVRRDGRRALLRRPGRRAVRACATRARSPSSRATATTRAST